MHRLHAPGALVAAVVLAACSRPAPPAAPASDLAAAPPAGQTPSTARDTASSVPTIANKIWKVAQSSAGDSASYYVFLGDGTMLVTSKHGTPAIGSWHLSGEVLTMVEEGIPHSAIVLQATPDTLAIRIAGPGQPVQITFVPVTAR
jgi:hypothetical protein